MTYCVGTWDKERQGFTPQSGVRPWFNLTLGELRAHLKALRRCGYSAHRRRDGDGDHSNNDSFVLVEKTEGRTAWQVYKEWQR